MVAFDSGLASSLFLVVVPALFAWFEITEDEERRGKAENSFSPVPSVGDEIYVPSALYISHGEDDILGGRAVVKSVKKEKHGNDIIHGVTVQELPNRTYFWENGLADKQEELRKEFGDGRARPDPDKREEFNSGSIITQDVIRRWLKEAKERGATHVIVVSDTFDYTYCPVSVMPGEDPREKAKAVGSVTEVYSLARDIESQLSEHRAFHFD